MNPNPPTVTAPLPTDAAPCPECGKPLTSDAITVRTIDGGPDERLHPECLNKRTAEAIEAITGIPNASPSSLPLPPQAIGNDIPGGPRTPDFTAARTTIEQSLNPELDISARLAMLAAGLLDVIRQLSS